MMTLVSAVGRQERRKQRTTAAILDAAERLLLERGFAGMTIEAISEEADVAIGSIYARFAGKDGVYVALAQRAVEANEAAMAGVYAAGSPGEQITAFADAYLRFHREHPLAFRLVTLQDLERPLDDRLRQARGRLARRLDAMVGDLAGALERATRAGEIRAVDARATATFLWGSFNGAIALRRRGAISEREFTAAVAVGQEVVRRGLAIRPPGS
jgi:AcrR family transcriptional regulator